MTRSDEQKSAQCTALTSVCGLAMVFASMAAMLHFPLFHYTQEALLFGIAESPFLGYLVGSFAALAACAATMVLRPIRIRTLAICSAAMLATAMAFFFYAQQPMAFFIQGAFIGAATSCAVASWCLVLARIDPYQRNISLACALIAAFSAKAILARLFPISDTIWLHSILLFASLALLIPCFRSIPNETPACNEDPTKVVESLISGYPLILGLVVCGLYIGSAWGLISHHIVSLPQSDDLLFNIGCVAGALQGLFTVSRKPGQVRLAPTQVTLISALLLISGWIVSTLPADPFPLFGSFITGIGIGIFFPKYASTIFRAANNSGRHSIIVMATAQIVFLLAIATSSMLIPNLGDAYAGAITPLAIVALIAVVTLRSFKISMPDSPKRMSQTKMSAIGEKGLHPSEGQTEPLPTKAEDALTGRINQLSQECGLSNRESQVFSYLARGYSQSYIADCLFVSGNTVKTHCRHIYDKLHVHSKNELLALVEKTRD